MHSVDAVAKDRLYLDTHAATSINSLEHGGVGEFPPWISHERARCHGLSSRWQDNRRRRSTRRRLDDLRSMLRRLAACSLTQRGGLSSMPSLSSQSRVCHNASAQFPAMPCCRSGSAAAFISLYKASASRSLSRAVFLPKTVIRINPKPFRFSLKPEIVSGTLLPVGKRLANRKGGES